MTSLVALSIFSFLLFIILPIFIFGLIARYLIKKLTGQKPEALLNATHRSIEGWVEKR